MARSLPSSASTLMEGVGNVLASAGSAVSGAISSLLSPSSSPAGGGGGSSAHPKSMIPTVGNGAVQRSFVLTRAFWAGSQRFGAMWTGS